MNRISVYIFLLICSACVGLKPLGTTTSHSLQSVIQQAQAASLKVDWFTSHLKGQAQWNGQSYPLTAQLRIKTDSVIWISLSALMGIEAARIQLSPDSLKILNRLNNTYYKGPIQGLAQRYDLPLSFYQLQEALLGALIPQSTKGFQLTSTANEYHLSSLQKHEQTLLRLNSDFLPIEWSRMQGDSQYVRLSYKPFLAMDSVWLPNSIQLEAQQQDQKLSLELDYFKTAINKPKKVNFSVPSSYAPM